MKVTVEESLNKDRLKLKHSLEDLKVLYLTEGDFRIVRSIKQKLFNMNELNDYQTVRKLVEEGLC
jgi:hypothetical protein